MTLVVSRAKWEFIVGVDEQGDVVTKWSVWSDEGGLDTESDHGEVKGPLHTAIFAAYDALGIPCPFFLDLDLLKLGGHKMEGADDDVG